MGNKTRNLARRKFIECDPPGIASNDLGTIAYEKKSSKVYPLDKDATYP